MNVNRETPHDEIKILTSEIVVRRLYDISPFLSLSVCLSLDRIVTKTDANAQEEMLRAETSQTSEYSLNVQSAKIERIGDLSKFKNIRTINLSCNRISKIEGLEGLADLRGLQLYNNALRDMDGIRCNRRLEKLHLHSNHIEEISVDISELKMLKELRLGHNKIRSISYHLSHCRTLRHLDLSENQLTSLDGVGALKNLSYLDVSRNGLDSSTLGELRSCVKIEELRMSHNKIEKARALKPLSKLTVLDLSFNRVVSLRAIASLPHLSELHLKKNLIEDLGRRSLHSRFPLLDTLDISFNFIKDMPTLRVLEPSNAPQLRELWLEGNDINIVLHGETNEDEDESQTSTKVDDVKDTSTPDSPLFNTFSDHIAQSSVFPKHFTQLDALNGRSLRSSPPSRLPRPVSRRSTLTRTFLSREEICERARRIREKMHSFREFLGTIGDVSEPTPPAPDTMRTSRNLVDALKYAITQESNIDDHTKTSFESPNDVPSPQRRARRPPRTILTDTKTSTTPIAATALDASWSKVVLPQRPTTAPAAPRDDDMYEPRFSPHSSRPGTNHLRPKTARSTRSSSELRAFNIPPKARTVLEAEVKRRLR